MIKPNTINYTSFKRTLTSNAYTSSSLAKTLSLSEKNERQDIEVVYHRVRDDNPYNLLVRLFWLGRKLPEETIRKQLPSLDLNSLIRSGLITRSNGNIRSSVKLAPYHDLYLISDFGPQINPDLPSDHVLGVGAASLTLASLTVRRKVGKALDLGCGAGIQAFLISDHAQTVIGTDTNSRSLNFARFNAEINGIQNIEWKNGSLFEPVTDDKFDLIACNPPFVISPESKFIYRDTPMPGDSISQQIIKQAAHYLNDDGFACILFNWHHKSDSDWSDRPLSWINQNGCDTWLICFKTAEPIIYAADWLKDIKRNNPRQYTEDMNRWLAYYEEQGIDRISAGAMILRKCKKKNNWIRADLIDKGTCLGNAADQIERVFAAEDLLQNISDDEFIKQRLVFEIHHELKHRYTVEKGQWALKDQILTITKGIPFSGSVDMYISGILAQCDGSKTILQLIEPLVEKLDSSPDEITTTCLNIFKKLLRAGFFSIV